MAQTDMNVADQSGADFLVDINDHLEAIATSHSGTSRPSTVFPGQCWIKTDYGSNQWGVYRFDGAQDALVGVIDTSAHTWKSDNADRLDGEYGAYYNDTPNGTKAVFYQASAPTGWTQDTSVNDRVIRVVSGQGGGTGGSWTISGLTVQGHTLSDGQMPSHNHGGGNHNHSVDADWRATGGDHLSVDRANTTVSTNNSGTIINTNGSDNPHSHGISHDGGWRPSYIDTIVCTRSK